MNQHSTPRRHTPHALTWAVLGFSCLFCHASYGQSESSPFQQPEATQAQSAPQSKPRPSKHTNKGPNKSTVNQSKNDATSTNPNAASTSKYTLPKLELTYEIATYQILSDLALNRGDYSTAYEGYMLLAKQTRDPRYAERAYIVATTANDLDAALKAADQLKAIAPKATLGDDLKEQIAINAILERSEQGQLTEALKATQAFLKKHPKHLVALNLYADIASKLKLKNEALNAFERIYALTPNDADALNNLGFFLIDHNLRIKEAASLIERALALNPSAPHIIDSAAWLAYRQNQLPQALNFAQKAYAQLPSHDVGLHLVEIYWANGLTDQANALLQRIENDLKRTSTQPNENALQPSQIAELKELIHALKRRINPQP